MGILASVGAWEKGAKNLKDDVMTVQQLLTQAATQLGRPELDPRGIDGGIAKPPVKSDTVKAICASLLKSVMPTLRQVNPPYTMIGEAIAVGMPSGMSRGSAGSSTQSVASKPARPEAFGVNSTPLCRCGSSHCTSVDADISPNCGASNEGDAST